MLGELTIRPRILAKKANTAQISRRWDGDGAHRPNGGRPEDDASPGATSGCRSLTAAAVLWPGALEPWFGSPLNLSMYLVYIYLFTSKASLTYIVD